MSLSKKMKEERYTQLIIAELTHTINPEDQRQLKAWLNESPNHQAIYTSIEKLWIVSEAVETEVAIDLDEEFARFKRRIQPAAPARKIRPLWRRTWLRAAAVLLFISAGTWLFFQNSAQEGDIAWTTVSSQSEKTTIELPDQSTIWLNKHSQVSYPTYFKQRMVKLEGEAYFDVAKHKGKNFVIEAGATTTEVLGTTFNVRAYQEEPVVEVVVFSGKVSFEDPQAEVILMPEDKGTYHKKDQKLEKARSQDANVLSWKSGQFQFSGESLSLILPQIERAFDIEIKTSHPDVLNCTFTGNFAEMNAQELLESIAFGLHLELVVEENNYRLEGKGCQ